MERILSTWTAVLFLLCGMPAGAAEAAPDVVFPAGYTLPASAQDVVTVDVALLQIRLAPGQVLSAQRGTRYSITTAGGVSEARQVNVLRGTLTLVDIQTNTVMRLPPGSYVIGRAGISRVPEGSSGDRYEATADDTESLSPRYRLADAVMTQQQKYLDSLKIDIRDINHVLASIIRGLVPRRQ